MKVLRTDRGGEFLSRSFVIFCEEEGNERHLTAPYIPQKNVVVERRNHTIMATSRSLLKSMHVLGRMWGEAVKHVVYLLNHLPTKALCERTSFEAWTSKKPSLAHLRVFGCTAHVKVARPDTKKQDDRSMPLVYLGVEEGSKIHCLYDPRRNKIHVSRYVVFVEEKKWQWDGDCNCDLQIWVEFSVEEHDAAMVGATVIIASAVTSVGSATSVL